MNRLREYSRATVLALVTGLMAPALPAALSPGVQTLDVEIEVGEDGVLTVVERIVLETPTDLAPEQPLRQLPLRVDTTAGYTLDIEYALDRIRLHAGSEAEDGGREIPLEPEDTEHVARTETGGLAICAGCVKEAGQYMLVLAYRTLGSVSTGADVDRLYWPLLRSNQPDMGAREARVAVTMPADVPVDEISIAALHETPNGEMTPVRVATEFRDNRNEDGVEMLLRVPLPGDSAASVDMAAAWPAGHVEPTEALPGLDRESMHWLVWTLYLLVGMVMLTFIVLVIHSRTGS